MIRENRWDVKKPVRKILIIKKKKKMVEMNTKLKKNAELEDTKLKWY